MAKSAATKKAVEQVSITLPKLAKGEHYAGLILEKGKPAHHLVLLPGELESATWRDAVAWAKKQGGELPSRREQSLLFANAKEHFQERWYWSGEQVAGDESYAWTQGFLIGTQYDDHKDNECRARAVRRVGIQ